VDLGSGPTIFAKLERGGAPDLWARLSVATPKILLANATIKWAAADRNLPAPRRLEQGAKRLSASLADRERRGAICRVIVRRRG
jgi:hypothetical protein